MVQWHDLLDEHGTISEPALKRVKYKEGDLGLGGRVREIKLAKEKK